MAAKKVKKVKYDYSEGIQVRIVGMFLYDSLNIAQNIDIIKPEYFDNDVLKNFMEIIIAFYEKYKKTPNFDEFIEEVGLMLDKKARLPSDEYWKMIEELGDVCEEGKFEYVKDKVTDFARYQPVKNAILESIEQSKKRRIIQGLLRILNQL